MLSVNWGAWAGSGMAAKAGIDRMARLGFGALAPDTGMAAIGRIIAGIGSLGTPQLLGSVFFWDRSQAFPAIMKRTSSFFFHISIY